MKPIDNRQNKLIQTKAGLKHPPIGGPAPSAVSPEGEGLPGPVKGGAVYGLISNLLFASKIAQSAKHAHLGVHNFDKAEPLIEHAKLKPPLITILDWDGCEAEAFKLLKVFQQNADLKRIPVVGYLSHVKSDLKEEAERAGCPRVYFKSEFTRLLDDILLRYNQ